MRQFTSWGAATLVFTAAIHQVIAVEEQTQTRSPDLTESSVEDDLEIFDDPSESSDGLSIDELSWMGWEYDGKMWMALGRERKERVDLGGWGWAKHVWMTDFTDGPFHCYDRKAEGCQEKERASTWGEWSEFAECSVTCGTGVRTRHRTCPENGECFGDSTEEETCFQAHCPNDKADKPHDDHESAEGDRDDGGDNINEDIHADVEDDGDINQEDDAQDQFSANEDGANNGDNDFDDDNADFDDEQPEVEETIEVEEEDQTKAEQEDNADHERDGDNMGDTDGGHETGPDFTDDDKKQHEDEEEEEEEDKDEEEERKSRRRRKKRKRKQKQKENEESSSSSESSGEWSIDSRSSSSSGEHEPRRPNHLTVDVIRPRSSSYGALSSPNVDIDDDIPSTPDDGSFRIGLQGPWQYTGETNISEQYSIADQYAMPVPESERAKPSPSPVSDEQKTIPPKDVEGHHHQRTMTSLFLPLCFMGFYVLFIHLHILPGQFRMQ